MKKLAYDIINLLFYGNMSKCTNIHSQIVYMDMDGWHYDKEKWGSGVKLAINSQIRTSWIIGLARELNVFTQITPVFIAVTQTSS